MHRILHGHQIHQNRHKVSLSESNQTCNHDQSINQLTKRLLVNGGGGGCLKELQ